MLSGQTNWYALNSGNWDDFNNWTLDPAAAIHVNPSNSYPSAASHNVIIKTGVTITVPVKDPALVLNCGTIIIDGRLDLGTTSGHIFTAIRGSGRILMKGDNFPAGNASHFITSGQGEGTVVFQGNSFALNNARTYYNMEVEMNAGQTLSVGANIMLNNNLKLVTGTLNVGNNTTARTLLVNGDVIVNSGSVFGATNANAIHLLEVFGNFTNNGTVQFSNAAQYAAATTGAVKVVFKGTSNKTLAANGTTNFYRMFINKGVDQSYTLSVTSNNSANFKLFGPITGSDGLEAADGTLGYEQLPIVLRNGTLKLGSNIVIPQLGYNRGNSDPREFTVPATAGFWIDGATVTTATGFGGLQDWTGISLFGTLKITAGTLTSPALSSGISYYNNASTPANLIINGGNILLTQLRQKDTNGRLNYSQTAGVVHFNALSANDWSSPVFSLPNASQVFTMGGGELIFNVANNNNVTGIFINSADGNHNVTGGMVEVRVPSNRDFKICSQAPFFNLKTTSTGSARKVWMTNLHGGNDTFFDGELTVLNHLEIASGTVFDAGAFNLLLGGDLTVNGTFNPTGKITLNGAANGTITKSSGLFTINKLFIDKASSSTSVSLAGGGTFAISDSLTLLRGNLNLANYAVAANGHISLFDGGIGATGTGKLILSGGTARTLYSAKGKDLNFGVLELNNTASAPQITFSSHAKAKDVRFLRDQVVDLGPYNLEIETANYTAGSWGVNRRFRTSGLASDGGLTLPVVLNANYGSGTIGTIVQLFPVGSTSTYNPMTLYARNTLNTTGFIRVVPVNNTHPTVDDSKKNDAIPYYWRVWNNVGVTANDLRYLFLYGSNIANNLQKDRVLTNYVWSEPGATFPGDNSISFNFGAPLEQDYTCGNQSAFNSITRLYSKVTGDWNAAGTWTTNADHSTGTGSVPKSYDVVIIGGNATTGNHQVTISANTAVASQVEVKGKSDTNIGVGNDAVAPPSLIISNGTSGHIIDLIKGKGRIIHQNNSASSSSFTMINGDYTEFCNSPEAIMEFTGTGAGPRIMPAYATIASYPNLHITGSAGTTQFNGGDLKVKGNLFVGSTTFNLPATNNGMVDVAGDVIIHNGTMGFSTGWQHHMTINGNLRFTGNGTFNGQSGSAEKNLYLKGNIELGSGNIAFNTTQKINTIFTGTQAATYTKGAGSGSFYRITIDKPEGTTVHFNNAFTLPATAAGTIKNLVLQSGTAILNNSGIDINLSTGGADFKIPSTSILKVDNGATVRIGGNASNTGLWLDGSLVIDNSGKALLNQGSGSFMDNYIQYTASGKSSLWIGNSAELRVGSQIRRATNTNAGALIFNQAKANSTIVIGEKSAPTNDRGVFEILNVGSSFTQTEANSNITVMRAQTTPTTAALYFNPATVSSATGSGFTIGGAVNGQTIGIFAGKPLQNITLSGTNAPVGQVWTSPITINENLTINTGATFNANALNITIKGNLVNAGTYLANGNTTYFSGLTNQTITGSTTFYNLVKNGGSSRLSLTGSTAITVSNNLSLETGSFDTSENSVVVNGNASIGEGFYTLSSGISEGFIMRNEAVQQRLTGTGTFARLTIDNPIGVYVPTQSSSVKYSHALRLKRGVLDIGRNLMIVEKNATIVPVNPFSTSNMIQTNLSFTDAGVLKYIPAGATSVVFPIGSGGKYTPVTLTVTANSSDNGYFRVKAADEAHLTVAESNKNNVLNYNWTLDAAGVSGFSGNAVMQAVPSDAKVTDPFTLENYIAARILAGSSDWNKLSNIVQGGVLIEGFDKNNHRLVFNFNNTNSSLINGDYTAGIASAIPDQVPSYITVTNGNWSNASIWAVYNPVTNTTGVAGVNVPEGGPRGSIVYINNELNITQNFMSAYRTRINSSGILKIGNTVNHRLGTVTGQGRMVLLNGSFPAGTYDDFFALTGGIVEFTGNTDYDILSEIAVVNHLLFTGTGQRRLSNLQTIVVQGALTIDGPQLVNEFSKTTSVKGNILFNTGSYVAKTGTVELSGTTSQTIGGAISFSGTNAFYNLSLNNGMGITLQNHAEVSNMLTFGNGLINTSESAKLTLSNSESNVITGFSATKYVSGPLRKNINTGQSFTYPSGKDGRYGQLLVTNVSAGGLWEVEYFNTGAPDRNNFDASVKYVSSNEYWKVTAPSAGANAEVTLRWDANSGVNPDDDAFKVVSATGSTWAAVDYTNKIGNMASGSVKTISLGYNTSRRFTFGSFSIAPYTWTGATSTDWFTATNWSGNVVPSASNNTTIATSSRNPIIAGGFTAQTNDLTINNGAVLTVGPSGKLTTNGNLVITTASGLVMENQTGVNGMASFINKGSITGSANLKLTLPKDQWFYISSAIHGATFGNFNPAATGASVYVYRTNKWVLMAADQTGNAMQNLEGALVKYSPASNPTFTLNYSGAPTSGLIERTYTAGGWNLFGNPYPSFINWQNDAGWVRPNIDGTIWYRTKIGNVMTFITYNRLAPTGARVALYPSGSTGNEAELALIPPMQAVWIKVFAPTTISVNNNMRSHGVAGSQLKSASTNSTADVIRITTSNSQSQDGAVIYFDENATEGIDAGDSEKRLNDSQIIPEVYSRMGNTSLAINGLLPLGTENRSIPISVRNRNEENVVLTFDLSMFNSGHTVTLEDRETGEMVNLMVDKSYIYTPLRLGEVHDRFVIHLNFITTSVVNPEVTTPDKGLDGITITGIRGRAIVKVSNQLLENGEANIEIYTLDGQKISESRSGSVETMVVLPRVDALFIVKVSAGEITKTEKVKGRN